MAVGVRFECGSENRMSKDYGPYDFVQITYGMIRAETKDGEEWELATRLKDGFWLCYFDEQTYSDIVIY